MKFRILQTDYCDFIVQRFDTCDYTGEWIDIKTFEYEGEAMECLNDIKKGKLDKHGKFISKIIKTYEFEDIG